MRAVLLALFALTLSGCKTVNLDSSAFASVAGQSTIVLGACEGGFSLGWGQCLIEKSTAPLPTLRFVMTNPGEWAVSDCVNGIFKSGSVDKGGVVELDLAPLKADFDKNGLCILKIETVEHYPDPKDPSQLHSIPMRGGLFVEAVEPGYFPTPDNNLLAFCVKVMRTTKGRTVVEQCTP